MSHHLSLRTNSLTQFRSAWLLFHMTNLYIKPKHTIHEWSDHIFKTFQLFLTIFQFLLDILRIPIVTVMYFIIFPIYMIIIVCLHLILDWIISLSSSSWSSFFMRFVNIISFFAVLGSCTDMHEANDSLLYFIGSLLALLLLLLCMLNIEITDVVAIV